MARLIIPSRFEQLITNFPADYRAGQEDHFHLLKITRNLLDTLRVIFYCL